MSEIRGYVVALQDATLVDGKNIEVWWSFFDGSYEGSCSSQLDDFLGYSNTKLIETAASNRCGGLAASNDNFPAAYYATVAYEEVCPAPEASSGWFLPSLISQIHLRQGLFQRERHNERMARKLV